ncbi:Cadmium, cobalt and zinc/H(+)-K(+) antiporter [Andreprevotia sp. IGB-42]|uniref:cation diffusion facilitator family transporter n=1 Tax=Andreprevotia sp. IGB-42 TaxID=2497473 RepID=UPI00135A4EF4|nr:cation diffusion facilitator family transporter [Andreprevotia sp. IGB-42]KAF0812399.1 Cadmium, cobalt and zinc/H(+)-K(+) antiporter [Andreprevotia sp. IGB-42]
MGHAHPHDHPHEQSDGHRAHTHPHDQPGGHNADHDHTFDRSHHHHDHAAQTSQRRLLLALAVTGGFALVELFGGWWTGSLALISDAGHMLTDTAALALALLANYIGQRPADTRQSYGYARAELIGALVNSLAMIALVVWICVEAVLRLRNPAPVNGLGVMVIAVIGLCVNVISAWALSHDHDNLNSRAALIHVLGDLLGSVAAIAAGAVIWFTGWLPIDPILSVAVSLLILRSTWQILRQSTHELMDGVPSHLSLNDIGQALAAEAGVNEVHDLHVWNLGRARVALSAHLVVAHGEEWPALRLRLATLLKARFGIDHVTLQPDWRYAPAGGRVIPIEPAAPLHPH